MSDYLDFPAHMAQMLLLDSMCEICRVNNLAAEQFTSTFVCGTFPQIIALACIGMAAGRCCFQYNRLRKIYESDVTTAGVKSELENGDPSPQPDLVVKSKRKLNAAESVGTNVQEAAIATNSSTSISETNMPSVVSNPVTPGRDVITPSYSNTNFDINKNESSLAQPEKKYSRFSE